MLIGLVGLIGSGKDTVAERLDQEINNFAEGGTPHSFVIG